jgi:aldehyde:ferredoxin oxidoreductase
MPLARAKLERFQALFGWANRLLRIDLSNRTIAAEPLPEAALEFIGGRGLAAYFGWHEYPDPVDPFAPENPLMVMPGALTGSRSPYSGRTAICGFSPQAFPFGWFTRANIGSQFGAALKKAGYDGVIITGASERPVMIAIADDEVTIEDASDLWGLDTFDTQEAVAARTSRRNRTLTIGPAGENLSRIATVHTATSSTAGQGGFGAVMGSKRLKAITVLGTGDVDVAHPGPFDELVRAVGDEVRSYRIRPERWANENAKLACDRGGQVRPYACTASCPTPCNAYYANMPGVAYPDRHYEGHWACVGSSFRGIAEGGPVSHGGLFDWQLGLYGGFELNVLSNRLGLNQWDLIMSMVPWLECCQRQGLLTEINGRAIDWRSPEFWVAFLDDIAYRRGMGAALAEGGLRAAYLLDLGADIARRFYTAWGFGGHWDGHAGTQNHIVYPFWIVSALQWATDTRDPYSSSHGYVQNVMRWGPIPDMLANRPITGPDWDDMKAISARVYGTPDALDPESGYRGKAVAAWYHDLRSVMKDSLPTDDQVFPLIYTTNTDDHYCRLGEIEGPSVDYHLFRLGTGSEWTESDFYRAAERVYTLERAICVRHFGRDRAMDERAVEAFTYPENWVSPVLNRRYALDPVQFKPVLDAYYRQFGWDPATGWPTPERLQALGLGDVYDEMASGAERANQRGIVWPDEPAIDSSVVELADVAPAQEHE